MLDLIFEADSTAVLERTIAEFLSECIGVPARNIDDQNIVSPQFMLDKVKQVVDVLYVA